MPLRAGDVLGVGDILLLVVSEAVVAVPSPDEIARSARRGAPILFVGETGVGRVARRLVTTPPAAVRSCPAVRTLAPDRIAEELSGSTSRVSAGPSGLVERADRGTLLLDDVDDAPPALRLPLGFIENGEADASARRCLQGRCARPGDGREPAACAPSSGAAIGFVCTCGRSAIAGDVPLLTRDLLAAHGRWRGARSSRRSSAMAFRTMSASSPCSSSARSSMPATSTWWTVCRVAGALGLADVGFRGAGHRRDGTWFRPRARRA